MDTLERSINGPQSQHEYSHAEVYRDTTSLTSQLVEFLKSPFCASIFIILAISVWFKPATAFFILFLSPFYAMWILITVKAKLPLHLPIGAAKKDYGNPDPKNRKARPALGTLFLGNEATTGNELWLSNDACRQHGTLPGTTGAGKTTSIKGIIANALSQGSGVIIVDGKAQNTLYGDVYALARQFGREDDVLALNFLVASDDKDSNSFNPFITGNADAIRELIASMMGEGHDQDPNGIFRERAVALIATIVPPLVWMRDHYNIPIDVRTIRFSLDLAWIWELAKNKQFLIYNPDNENEPFRYYVADIPNEILYPLNAYLGELPGYDTTLSWDKQRENKPAEQHGYARMYFTGIFQQLSVSLGHIFNHRNGDIDMRDIVLNRRILVVNLPSLENSDATQAALGRIVVSSLRGVMAQLLGAKLDGDPNEIFNLSPGAGDAPFHVIFDEVGYYATSGMDRMLAQARSLNIMIWLSFQDLSALRSRLGEKTDSLLGNANLTVAMRLQDVGYTKEWIEKTAGKTMVRQASNWEGNILGTYRESRSATTQEVNRINFLELQRMIEGEAIIMFAGRIIRSNMFHVINVLDGPIRRIQPIPLPSLTDLNNTDEPEENILASYFHIYDHQVLLDKKQYPVWSPENINISQEEITSEKEIYTKLIDLEIYFDQPKDIAIKTSLSLLNLNKQLSDQIKILKQPKVKATDDKIIEEIRNMINLIQNHQSQTKNFQYHN